MKTIDHRRTFLFKDDILQRLFLYCRKHYFYLSSFFVFENLFNKDAEHLNDRNTETGVFMIQPLRKG
ncbi:hypothetical cytosolic protein [Syntrophus aciditrophicus SB]|uniref:Hypothetical cytosolic protein n=1 Tax=Syntrophus aciditrophicus (strain SB) TaxID=56780 RepID=Q2LRJ2_SYNAS|nr:hypothetical cytosolic protein [Syntrophus aciditrophicus SB]